MKDRSGENIGKVDDLLIDPSEHKVRFLIVASGGLLGIGKDKSFIPVDAITRVTPTTSPKTWAPLGGPLPDGSVAAVGTQPARQQRDQDDMFLRYRYRYGLDSAASAGASFRSSP